MHIWNQLTLSSEQQRGYNKMVGHTTQLTHVVDASFAAVSGPCSGNDAAPQTCAARKSLPETTLYVPLQFWYCRNPGLALPLIALQYHEVKINIDFRAIGECLWAVSGAAAASRAYQQSLVAASLYVDYIFLDTDERRKMAQNPHEYLIEQVQFTGDESVGSSSNRIKLNFNHPCKELVWVVQPDANVDYCSSLETGKSLFALKGAQPFNYTDALDVLPNDITAFATRADAADMIDAGEFSDAPTDVAGAGVGDASSYVLQEASHEMHCWGENPVVTAKLQLNGQDRFSEREGSYFDVVQPFQHHTRAPDSGINVYSFALRPEEHQPSGTCNFSRIDNAVLQLVLSSNTVANTNTAKCRVYAVNYNVLRVMSGMAGVAYSN
jgi:hypothetical protein